jgi:hypothetical protein
MASIISRYSIQMMSHDVQLQLFDVVIINFLSDFEVKTGAPYAIQYPLPTFSGGARGWNSVLPPLGQALSIDQCLQRRFIRLFISRLVVLIEWSPVLQMPDFRVDIDDFVLQAMRTVKFSTGLVVSYRCLRWHFILTTDSPHTYASPQQVIYAISRSIASMCGRKIALVILSREKFIDGAHGQTIH